MDEGMELNGGIRNGSISRMVVEGYDTSPPREDVEEALRKHFASHGIKLLYVCVPIVDDHSGPILCRCALIYVNGECEADALKLDGSDMGLAGDDVRAKIRHRRMGPRILQIKAYPFEDNSLEHVFVPTNSDIYYKYGQHTLQVTGFDTSLSENDIEKMLGRVFPGSDCWDICDGSALLYLHGQNAMDDALKLSGGFVEGFKFVVTKVLPRIVEADATPEEDQD